MYKVNGGQQTVHDASEKPCSLYVASTVCDYTTILDNCMGFYLHTQTDHTHNHICNYHFNYNLAKKTSSEYFYTKIYTEMDHDTRSV